MRVSGVLLAQRARTYSKGICPKLSVRCPAIAGRLQPPLSGTIEYSLVTQSGGIALSSPSKLDDRFGDNCHCGIIAIDQTQLTQSIFERHCEHRDSVRPKTSCSRSAGFKMGISRYALKHASPADEKKPNVGTIKWKIRGVF